MISGCYNFEDCFVRNFGVDLLGRSVFEINETRDGHIVALSLVRKGELRVSLVQWDPTGNLIPYPGLNSTVVKVGNNKSKGHIRDIAWGPENVNMTRGVKRNRRALAIATDETLLVFEVEFADDYSSKAFNLTDSLDIDRLLRTNSNDAKLLKSTKICSTCSRIMWHPSSLPTLFLFRSSGPPIRVGFQWSSEQAIPRIVAEVLVLNIRDSSDDTPISSYGGTIAGDALLMCSNSSGVLKCDNPLTEEAQAAKRWKRSTPAFTVSECEAELMCENDGILLVVYTSEISIKHEQPLLELNNKTSLLALLGGDDSFLANKQGKFRHVLAGESILSALSTSPDISARSDIEMLHAGSSRRDTMRETELLWREEVTPQSNKIKQDPPGGAEDVELGRQSNGPLSDLMNVATSQRAISLTDPLEPSSSFTSNVPLDNIEACAARRLRIIGVFGEEEQSKLPVLCDIQLPIDQPVDLGCIKMMIPDSTKLLFACAGKRARDIFITKIDLSNLREVDNRQRSCPYTKIVLPDGLTARGLSLRTNASNETAVQLLVLAVAKIEETSSLASHGAASHVTMSLVSYCIDDFSIQSPMVKTVMPQDFPCEQNAEGEKEVNLIADTDNVSISAAAAHHVSRLREVSDRRKILIEQGRGSELVCECCVEPGLSMDGQMYCLNVGRFDDPLQGKKTIDGPAAMETMETMETMEAMETMETKPSPLKKYTEDLQEILHAFSIPILEELKKQREAITTLAERVSKVESALSKGASKF